MRFLLDTHLVIWIPIGANLLSQEALEVLLAPEHELFFSAVSLWEITIKRGKGLPDFRYDPRALRKHMLASGFREIAIDGDHVLAVENLPPIHKDPFDRILIAQAVVEGITLLTADAVIAKYPGPIQKV